MTTEEKCADIIRAIVLRCHRIEDKSIRVGFSSDWGDNSLTVHIENMHSHVGDPSDTFDQLVDDLYTILVCSAGLSFV